MRILSIVLLIFFVSLYLYGTSNNITSNVILQENIEEPEVYFCPDEPCEEILIRYINDSNKSIHCALFDLDLEKVIKTLSEKSSKIEVKIVIDNENWDKRFSGKGIIQDTSSQLSHNKFCIFDEKIVWTGSFNPTNNGANKNNNNIIIIKSKNLADNYEDEFDELWNYNFGSGRKIKEPIIYLNNKKYENYFCPEDHCKQKVLESIDNAKESIYFMFFSFTDFDISNALVKKKQEGLEVYGVMEAQRINMQYNQYKFLKSNSVDVRKDSNPATMHHKVIIIDNRTTITGSYNPTKAADTKNDENLLIIHNKEITQKYLEEFKSIFLTSLK